MSHPPPGLCPIRPGSQDRERQPQDPTRIHRVLRRPRRARARPSRPAVVPSAGTASVVGQPLAAVPAGPTFSPLNFALLVPAVAMRSDTPVPQVAQELWLGDLQIYPFAVLGVVLGRLFLSLGAWIVPL